MKFRDLNFFRDLPFNETFVSLDTDGNLVIEGYKKLLDYTANKIQLIASSKIMYIYGENLTVISCTRHTAFINGIINKIELFEVNDA